MWNEINQNPNLGGSTCRSRAPARENNRFNLHVGARSSVKCTRGQPEHQEESQVSQSQDARTTGEFLHRSGLSVPTRTQRSDIGFPLATNPSSKFLNLRLQDSNPTTKNAHDGTHGRNHELARVPDLATGPSLMSRQDSGFRGTPNTRFHWTMLQTHFGPFSIEPSLLFCLGYTPPKTVSLRYPPSISGTS